MTPTTVRRTAFSVTSFPTIEGSEPKRPRHSGSLITTIDSRPSWPSSGRNVRPIAGLTASASKNSVVTLPDRNDHGITGTGQVAVVRRERRQVLERSIAPRYAAKVDPPFPDAASGYFGDSDKRYRRSGSGNGSGRMRTPLTTLNIATVVPMPRVSVRIAAVVNAGARRSVRAHSWRSRRRSLTSRTSLCLGTPPCAVRRPRCQQRLAAGRVRREAARHVRFD